MQRSNYKKAETTEEMIGVLMAISVVSKRLAQKMAKAEPPPKERSYGKSGKKRVSNSYAD